MRNATAWIITGLLLFLSVDGFFPHDDHCHPRRLTLARYCPPQAGFSARPESAGDCSPGCGDAECGGHCHHHLFCCGHFSCTPAVTPQDGPTLHFLHEHSDMRPVSPSTGHLPELIRPPRTA